MSWPVWSQGVGVAPVIDASAGYSGYTPEQWASMQQQNWQQWSQWHEQYTQWQSQYGEKYAEQLKNTSMPMPLNAQQPPLPSIIPSKPPPPPPPDGPPPSTKDNSFQSSSATMQYATSSVPNYGNIAQYHQSIAPPSANYGQASTSYANNYSSNNNYNNYHQQNEKQNDFNKSKCYDRASKAESKSKSSHSAKTEEEMNEEERMFEEQFEKWEEDFHLWKQQNANHPDTDAYREYEQKFETCREQLIQRKEQMKTRRLAAATKASKSQEKQKSKEPKSQNIPREFNESTNTNDESNNNSYPPYTDDQTLDLFPNISDRKGIPGLDLVEKEPPVNNDNNEIIDLDKDEEVNRNTKLLDSILGDKNLLQMISMVSSNPNKGSQHPQKASKWSNQDEAPSSALPLPNQFFSNKPPLLPNPLITSLMSHQPPIPPLMGQPPSIPPLMGQLPMLNSWNSAPPAFRRDQGAQRGMDCISGSGIDNMQEPGMGNMQGPRMGNMQGPRMGNLEGPGMGDMKGPRMSNLEGPGMQNNQRRGMGNMQGPGMENMQGCGMGNMQGHGMGNMQGRGMGDTQGPGMSDTQGRGMGDMQGRGMGDKQGRGTGDMQGRGMGDTQGRGMGDTQGRGMGDTQGRGMGDTQSRGMGDTQGRGMGDTQGRGMGDTQGRGMGDTQGRGMGDTQGPGMGNVQGDFRGRNMGNMQESMNDMRKGRGKDSIDGDDGYGMGNMRNSRMENMQVDDYENDGYRGDTNYMKRGNQNQNMPFRGGNDMRSFGDGRDNGMYPNKPNSNAPYFQQYPGDIEGDDQEYRNNRGGFGQQDSYNDGHNQPDEPPGDDAANKPEENPAWMDIPLVEPVTILDYQHLPKKLPSEFFEPVQIFDYNHESKKDKPKSTIDTTFLELDSYHNKVGATVIDYENKPTGDAVKRYSPDREREPSVELISITYDRPREERYDRYKRGERYERSREEREDYGRGDRYPNDRDYYRNDYERRGRSREADWDDRNRDRSWRPDDRGRPGRYNRRSTSRERDLEQLPCPEPLNEPNDNAGADGNHRRNIVMIDDLLEPPGRDMRPEKIAIVMRGLPGSGKSFLAKLIKEKEQEKGRASVRILSVDDYFMTEVETEKTNADTGKKEKVREMQYEYDDSMEKMYITSLLKSVKKTASDGFFSFIIVDAVNNQFDHLNEIVSSAKRHGFVVYICEMENDLQNCFKRNIHNRTLKDIEDLNSKWYTTPPQYTLLDTTTLLQSAAIDDVDMEDVCDEELPEFDDDLPEFGEDQQEDEVQPTPFSSKWDHMDNMDIARLDGINKPLRHTASMEDYLQLDEWTVKKTSQPGKKTVRWADIEERIEQEKMRAIGFVVGQTDWQRMTDPTKGSAALTQTKYIERVKKN